MSVRPVVERYLSAGATIVSCEDIRAFCEEHLGYPVQGTAVSRVMGNLGWQRFTESGKVHFRQPWGPKA